MKGFTQMLMGMLMAPRQQFRAGTPSRRKGSLNEKTVKGDKLARALSRGAGNVYGRKTWL